MRLNALSLPGSGAETIWFNYDSAGRFSQALVGHCFTWTSPPDSASYSYDADGNLTGRNHSQLLWPTDSGNFLYTWSADGRLLSASREGQPVVYYDYNALGQLVRKWHGNPSSGGIVTRRYVYDRGQLIAELDATHSNQRLAEYVYETETDKPYALITGATSPSQIQYYFQDAAGNVFALVGGTTVKQSVTYSDWGIPTITGDTTNHLLWKGLQYEPETRMYYVRNRWYSPELALFVSEDPAGFGDGLNLYSFATDDPINGWDPSGAYTGWDPFGNHGAGPGFDLPVEIGSILGKLVRAHGRNLGVIPKVLPQGKSAGKVIPTVFVATLGADVSNPLNFRGLNFHVGLAVNDRGIRFFMDYGASKGAGVTVGGSVYVQNENLEDYGSISQPDDTGDLTAIAAWGGGVTLPTKRLDNGYFLPNGIGPAAGAGVILSYTSRRWSTGIIPID